MSGHTSRTTPSFSTLSVRFPSPSQVKHSVDSPSSVDRMPTVIGHFISRQVYNSKLGTKHPISTLTCCRFVDVSNGKEIKKGLSWTVGLPNDTDPTFVLTHAYPERGRSESCRPNSPALHPRRKKVQDYHSLRRPTQRGREGLKERGSRLGKYGVQC